MEPGELCVVLAGTCRMPQSSVVNWAMAELWLHFLIMEEEVVQFGMMMCAAMAGNPASLSVTIVVLECIIIAFGSSCVTTVEMQECSVQVSDVASGVTCVCEEGGNRVRGNVFDLMVASFIRACAVLV